MRDEPILKATEVFERSHAEGTVILITSKGVVCSWCGELITAAGDSPIHDTRSPHLGSDQIGCGMPYAAITVVDFDPKIIDRLADTPAAQRYPIVQLSREQIEHIVVALGLTDV